MKLNCLIVDDEPIAQQILEKYIKQIDALHLVGKCNDAFEALNVLHRDNIDVLFLDIKMPSLTGLDMLKTLQHSPKVILTTAFSEFGVESYDYGITDYLLKPIPFERFLKAVNKILIPKNEDLSTGGMESKAEIEPTFIFFKADKKIHKYFFADILFIEGNGNYVKIHSQHEKPIMVLDKLTELQEKLPKKQFIRVHKSFIINVSHIQKIEGNMINIKQKVIPISATFKSNLEGLIQDNY
ncbi:MAG: LytTR family DNA-binding domain-containing protein [Flavobacterium sp.]|jgi:DNA-binding LytR/AlgR family response regulator|uniref:LytR/AlgR family response regulator transcription factor n=1 Tax=Flavobacterium sp. TaxID=239 RepID=UPI0022C37E36|nr:LytTR family DNA-binding domain-containing protein [Flavobacterium sp.]MCZ8023622.1 LytTR family DNA-binding domain-containing protein [Cytophagales bacterium]MCZ8331340.1 LytTR family DNA-binding domain-containing protein [Flavobacterium sp.]MCZ8355366.1 LytTR family DNA-binding domain-containing protein [Cyclobacteriaceae bacterium]